MSDADIRCSRRHTREYAGIRTIPRCGSRSATLQYHYGYGPQVGVPETEVVRSFDKAIALDSSFTPAYIHAIEMAFRYGTANGRRYLAAYLAQNPTDVDAEGMRLAWRSPILRSRTQRKRAACSTPRRSISCSTARRGLHRVGGLGRDDRAASRG